MFPDEKEKSAPTDFSIFNEWDASKLSNLSTTSIFKNCKLILVGECGKSQEIIKTRSRKIFNNSATNSQKSKKLGTNFRRMQGSETNFLSKGK